MNTPYAPSLTLRAARDLYFAANKFGADGGYSSPWVDFKLGPIPMPFPNSSGRVRAVRFHDLHHILTGYATDTLGEFDISAWELGAGCKDFYAAWQLNLTALATGMIVSPRRMLHAFRRGRRSESLYGRDLEEILARTVGEMREECGVDRPIDPGEAHLSDYPRLAAAWAAGILVGLVIIVPMITVAGPLLFIAGRLRGATSPGLSSTPSSTPGDTLVDSASPR